ncbi:hypothetical protein AWB80_08253 [Caballeronia pedi]|uniref:Uncharacterized protein n=1 Tax=Caballeronia pedi TaxID=1777141 RepID=A0A158E6G2_9BURK|nr:hypothetical protein AWB80_08253 [Caballeronia pedi]
MFVIGSVTAFGCEIWKIAADVITRPQSAFTPASYWFDLYGANACPAFAVPAGAVPPLLRPDVKLPYTEIFDSGLTTMPASGVIACRSIELCCTPVVGS